MNRVDVIRLIHEAAQSNEDLASVLGRYNLSNQALAEYLEVRKLPVWGLVPALAIIVIAIWMVVSDELFAWKVGAVTLFTFIAFLTAVLQIVRRTSTHDKHHDNLLLFAQDLTRFCQLTGRTFATFELKRGLMQDSVDDAARDLILIEKISAAQAEALFSYGADVAYAQSMARLEVNARFELAVRLGFWEDDGPSKRLKPFFDRAQQSLHAA